MSRGFDSKLQIQNECFLDALDALACRCGHVSEETKNADRTSPWGIMLAVGSSVILGFGYILSLLFSIQVMHHCDPVKFIQHAVHAFREGYYLTWTWCMDFMSMYPPYLLLVIASASLSCNQALKYHKQWIHYLMEFCMGHEVTCIMHAALVLRPESGM